MHTTQCGTKQHVICYIVVGGGDWEALTAKVDLESKFQANEKGHFQQRNGHMQLYRHLEIKKGQKHRVDSFER